MKTLFNSESSEVQASDGGAAIGRDSYGIVNTGTITFNLADRPHQKLTIPWRATTTDDFELLRWNTRISELRGRDEEMADLLDWAQKGQGVRARFITGEGGVGKTRLAMECGQILRGKGWEAGKFDLRKETPYLLGKAGTLLIIDYPEETREEIRYFLRELALQEESPNLCILFLSRHDSKFWQDDLDDTGASCFFAGHRSINLRGVEEVSKPFEIFSEACRKIEEATAPDPVTFELPTELHFNQWLARDQIHHRPLFILACALQYCHEPGALSLGGAEIIDALARRELIRLRRNSKAAGLDETTLPRLVAMAALRKGLTPDDLKQLAERPELEIIRCDPARVVDIVQTTGQMRDGQLPQPEPDIMAAALVVKVLMDRKDLAPEWLWHAIEKNIAQGLDRFSRLSYDAEYVLGHVANPLSSMMAKALDGNQERCLIIQYALNAARDSISLGALKAAVWETLAFNAQDDKEMAGFLVNLDIALHGLGQRDASLKAAKQAAEIYEYLAIANPDEIEPDLARSLNNLGNRYLELGHRDDALKAAEPAVEIYGRMACANPNAYEPYLATVLGTIGNIYFAVEQRDKALKAVEQAVEICERLACDNPSVYEPDLAGSLNNLGSLLSELGRLDDALKAVERAAKIYGRLADATPDAYEPYLAISLNNLGKLYSELGQLDEALNVAERAVEIRKRLAGANPDAYEQDLAASLNNLGAIYWELGQRDEALVTAERATNLFKRLSDTNPSAYEPSLAMCHNNLRNMYSEIDRREDALQAAERAVEIYGRLADTQPGTYTLTLARNLSDLGNRFSVFGRWDDALKAAEWATNLFKRLSDTNPSTYQLGLAICFNNLRNMYWELGRQEEALQVAERAAEIHEQLADVSPDVYEPLLAKDLNNLGIMYFNLGRRDEALTVAKRAMARAAGLTIVTHF